MDMIKRVEELARENERLREALAIATEALEFYDLANNHEIERDAGKFARDVLVKIREIEK